MTEFLIFWAYMKPSCFGLFEFKIQVLGWQLGLKALSLIQLLMIETHNVKFGRNLCQPGDVTVHIYLFLFLYLKDMQYRQFDSDLRVETRNQEFFKSISKLYVYSSTAF